MLRWTKLRFRAAMRTFLEFDLTRPDKARVALVALEHPANDEESRDKDILRAYVMGNKTLAVIAHEFDYSQTGLNNRINHYTDRVIKGTYRR